MSSERRIPIATDADIVVARQVARQVATELQFSVSDRTVIAAAISEIARNIHSFAGPGELRISVLDRHGRRGLQVIAEDHGPGIADVDGALEEGFSTIGGLGLGLPGARRLMDEFELVTSPDVGTTVTMRKWVR